MPLVWAHSGVRQALLQPRAGPPGGSSGATWNRYRGKRPKLDYDIWSQNVGLRQIAAGNTLCLALKDPARIHWGVNGWQKVQDIETRDTGLGVHTADLPIAGLAAGQSIQFTFYWRERNLWEGLDYEVVVTRKENP